MNALVPAAPVALQTFAVLLSRRSEVDAALAALVKRAARKGIPGALAWSWGKAYLDVAHVPNVDGVPPVPGAKLAAGAATWIIQVSRVPLALEGSAPRLRGWRFVATLQHLDGENVVRVLPGEEVPASYRSRGSACDHCRASRRRIDTYVLRHEDGRLAQVGSTCLRDFLGADDAAEIAAKAEILALAASVASGDGEGLGGGGAAERLLSDYLPVVAWCVRVEGWKSRTAAREQGGMATADRAWDLLTDSKKRSEAGCAPTAEDVAAAAAAEAWAEALSDEEVAASSSDYLHNLRAVARTGLASWRTAGIAASAVTAHQRYLGQERARAERAARPTLDAHVGAVGAKVTFGLPAKLGKRGQPLKGAPVALDAEPVVLDFVAGYQGEYGYVTVLKFRTAAGATLVWKASNVEVGRADVGKRYALAGTIKKHDDYKGAKQTILTRCSLEEV